MTQVGAPVAGEVLADRYRLEEHINDDSTGRQVWRGVDVILRRPVTIVMKCPGGETAEDMLQAAVAASRVVHPHTVSVYDAVDEGERAYVVREWIDGRSLRDIVSTEGPLDARGATAVAHAIADALSAVHATGTAHGNVNADTVMIGSEDRIVLADASDVDGATPQDDVRALGGVLYCALTGDWPSQLPGGDHLPPAPQLDGRLAAPRQVRGGIPSYLDALTMDLLDPALPPPSAGELAAELARLDVASEMSSNSGQLDLVTGEIPAVRPEAAPPRRPVWTKIALGAAGLAVIAVAGLLIGTNWVTNSANSAPPSATGSASAQGAAPTELKVAGGNVSLLNGDGDHGEEVGKVVDGNPSTGWKPQYYLGDPQFGKEKSGIGIKLDLGAVHTLSTVTIAFENAGTVVQIYTAETDPGGVTGSDTSAKPAAGWRAGPTGTTGTQYSAPMGEVKAQYVMIWITAMPSIGQGQFQTTVNEVTVRGH